LKASKMLRRWVEQGVLVADSTRGKRNMVYYKPVANGLGDSGLFSDALDNNKLEY
jgi:ATP-dependent DNA helicase RecG